MGTWDNLEVDFYAQGGGDGVFEMHDGQIIRKADAMQLDFDDGPDGRPRHRNLRHPQHRLAAGGNVKRQTIIPRIPFGVPRSGEREFGRSYAHGLVDLRCRTISLGTAGRNASGRYEDFALSISYAGAQAVAFVVGETIFVAMFLLGGVCCLK